MENVMLSVFPVFSSLDALAAYYSSCTKHWDCFTSFMDQFYAHYLRPSSVKQK